MRDDVGFREIDLASAADRDLRTMTLQAHGEALIRAASWTTRMFELFSACAPGLRFVGAQADPSRLRGAVPITGLFNLAGSGLRLEDALASCLGECIERLSQIEHVGDVFESAALDDVGPSLLPSLGGVVGQQLEAAGLAAATPLDWLRGQLLGSGEECLVPVDWVLRRQAPGPLLDPATALSTGSAAGRSFADAACRGLLELVERDAASQWWIGGRRGRPLALEDLAVASSAELAKQLRQGSSVRRTWLVDITSDLGIPVAAAMSVASDGGDFVCGVAARTTMNEAAMSAMLELCQLELGLLLSHQRHAELGDAGLGDVDRRSLARAKGIDPDRCELLHAMGNPSHHAIPTGQSDEDRLATLAAIFANHGIEIALIDLTRAELTVPVVRAVAPLLQLMPSGLKTVRLAETCTRYGGGNRWTQGIPLM